MNKEKRIKKIGQWYWILTSIWAVFWVLDVLVLVPLYPDGIMSNIKGIFSNQTERAFIYFLITAPVYPYLILILISKIIKKIRV